MLDTATLYIPMLQWHKYGNCMIINMAARVVSGRRPFDPITDFIKPILICYLLSNASNLRSAQWFSRTFTIIRQVSFQNLSFRLWPSHLCSSSQQVILVPRHRIYFSERAIAVAGTTMWSLFPVEVRNASTLITFRHLLKEHLFSTAYEQWCLPLRSLYKYAIYY